MRFFPICLFNSEELPSLVQNTAPEKSGTGTAETKVQRWEKAAGKKRSKAEARETGGALGHMRRNSHQNSVICNCYGRVGIEHSLRGCTGKHLHGLNLLLFK